MRNVFLARFLSGRREETEYYNVELFSDIPTGFLICAHYKSICSERNPAARTWFDPLVHPNTMEEISWTQQRLRVCRS